MTWPMQAGLSHAEGEGGWSPFLDLVAKKRNRTFSARLGSCPGRFIFNRPPSLQPSPLQLTIQGLLTEGLPPDPSHIHTQAQSSHERTGLTLASGTLCGCQESAGSL